MSATDLLTMLANRWGGLGLPCEAQPKASRANPQEDRRSLPHGSG
jgi:hypothetical protein